MSPVGSSIVRPVILCGGAGTRLWPVSRQRFPKQFLHLAGDKSLVRQTAERLTGSGFAPAIIVSADEQASLLEREFEGSNVAIEAMILEPVARNTAAAAALSAAWLRSNGRDELLLLMPSDHVINDPDAFVRAIESGIEHAADGAIVTFGATPTEPNTQYGYIEASVDSEETDARRIARFHEKPDAHKAAEYLGTGRFYWNCGIFLVKASTLLGEMQRFLPRTMEAIDEAIADGAVDKGFVRPALDAFSRAESISIDHAIMEKTSRGVVIPVDMQWSDVGAWDAVWKIGKKDELGNVIHGNVVTVDSKNSLLRAEGSARIAALGLDNICIIAVDDAILVAPMDRVAEVKDILARMTGAEPKQAS